VIEIKRSEFHGQVLQLIKIKINDQHIHQRIQDKYLRYFKTMQNGPKAEKSNILESRDGYIQVVPTDQVMKASYEMSIHNIKYQRHVHQISYLKWNVCQCIYTKTY